jgi:hypothetical protein
MASTTTKGDAAAVSSLAETVGIVCTLQQSMLRTESPLNKVEEASKVFAETDKLIVEKVDSIYKLSCNGILVNLAVTRNPHHHTTKPLTTTTTQAFTTTDKSFNTTTRQIIFEPFL